MGFEIMAFVPKPVGVGDTPGEKLATKKRVAIIRTIGTLRDNHLPALLLMDALDYELPDCGQNDTNLFEVDEEVYEGCGDVIDYKIEELRGALARIEDMVPPDDPSGRQTIAFLDKIIAGLEEHGNEIAEIGYY